MRGTMTPLCCGGRLWTIYALLSIAVAMHQTARASDKHTSLDEPFQSAFHSLKHSPCVTLYNRKGRSGCGTVDREAQSGPIFYYDGKSSVPQKAYVAVIEEYQLTSKTMNALMSSDANGNLKGVMVLNGTQADDTNEYASPGPIYPLGYSTPSEDISYGNNAFPWNSKGDGLIQYDLYGVPLVYINEYETSSYIRNAAQDAVKASEIYSEFTYYMGPDQITSKECLQWVDASTGQWNPKCQPLGGVSVWAFAGSPPIKSSSNYDANAANDDGNNNNNNNRKLELSNSYKSAVVIGTSIDSTSMFHDLVPGANEGASNTLTLLMAAYLLGKSVDDATLDALTHRIVFGFFEGEAYGYLGSRRFINDVLNFQCDDQYKVRSVAKDETSDMACLHPMRPSLKFKDIGSIAAMVTVDQVGVPAGDQNLFVHNSGQGDMGTFLANVMKYSGTNSFTPTDSAAGQNANQYPYPPSPLNSLLSVTGGNKGGAVLTGYDYAFTKRPPYQSHLNWIQNQDMDLNSIASAATILARTALAAAYDNGGYDYSTASSYAKNAISELAADNEMLVELADCLFVDGNCKLLSKYAAMDAANENARTEFDIGSGQSLGKPPNYYVNVYSGDRGQPFVRVGSSVYGAYDGSDYGKDSKDAIGMQPKMLQQAVRNLLSTFLGKGSMVDSSGNEASARGCSSSSDCSAVSYCSTDADSAICSAQKVCVCSRAFYHIALDEALNPSPNNTTGFFDFASGEAGVSPLWAEPFWWNVGVKMFRYSESNPGWIVLGSGAATIAVCFFVTVLVKVGMKKEKLF